MTETRYATTWWTGLDDGRVRCDVCPRACALHDGQAGLCFVRIRAGDRIVLTTYGRSSGFCVDPERRGSDQSLILRLVCPRGQFGGRAKWSCHSASSSGAMPASRSARAPAPG